MMSSSLHFIDQLSRLGFHEDALLVAELPFNLKDDDDHEIRYIMGYLNYQLGRYRAALDLLPKTNSSSAFIRINCLGKLGDQFDDDDDDVVNTNGTESPLYIWQFNLQPESLTALKRHYNQQNSDSFVGISALLPSMREEKAVRRIPLRPKPYDRRPAAAISSTVRGAKPNKPDPVWKTIKDALGWIGELKGFQRDYHFHAVLSKIRASPEWFRQVSLVQRALAEALLETGKYEEARRIYLNLFHSHHRWCPEGMDRYSTVLWHLQDHHTLYSLSKHLFDHHDHHHPQAWIALGNLYSLKRQHSLAVTCFRHAHSVQTGSSPYALILAGHDLLSGECYVEAEEAFRQALCLDPRNYKAIFGLGCVLIKRKQFPEALELLLQAHQCNPTNDAIQCYIGSVCQELGRYGEAEDWFTKAIIASTTPNTIAMLRRARLYMVSGETDKALEDLEGLVNLCPKEATVYFLIGEIMKGRRKVTQALKYYCMARDLDPVNPAYRNAIEAMEAAA